MNEMQPKKKRKIGLYILYGAVTVFFLVLVLSAGDITEIFETLKTAHFTYILLAIAAVLVYVALYPLSLCILTRARGHRLPFMKTYSISMIEHFFNGITPFATGGQPFQVYEFAKAKVKPSESTGLVMMNFIVFMLTTNAFALLSLLYFDRFVNNATMGVIAGVGFTLNFAVLICTIVLATSKGVRGLLCRFLDFLCRFRWISKFLEPKVVTLKEYFEQVQSAFSGLWQKKGAFFLALLTKAVSMAAYYMVTFFIMRALHVDAPVSDVFFIMSGTSFAITTVVFLPTPGSSGGIEFAFKSVFASIAAGAAASVAYGGMLIWRLLSYYFVMLISLGFYIALEIGFAKEKKEETEE